jgi:AraC-like DNA-binding protein
MRPRIRTSTLSGYAGLARSLGLDPAELMTSLGLDLADLDVPDRWIPAAPAARLLERSAQYADCADFGLRMAELRRLGTLGPISVVLRDEPDLRNALDLLIRYERTYNEALHMRLSEVDGVATLAVWLEFGDPAPTDQALDLVMGALLGIIRALVGNGWLPLTASFTRPTPADPRPHHRAFGPGVRFGQDHTSLVFPARDLAAPVLISDPSLRPYTEQLLHTLVGPRAPTVGAQVAEAVELLLPTGRCSIGEVCRHLGLRPRDLQRHLTAEGNSFSSIRHATRAQLAERYLPNDRHSLTEVSRLLGFGAPSAFSRWFHERFGASPSAWREATRRPGQHRSPGGAHGWAGDPTDPAPASRDHQSAPRTR